MANNLDLAQLRHDAQIVGANGFTEKRGGVDRGHVELVEPIGLLARRALLEDQVFVLIDMRGRLLGRACELFVSHTLSGSHIWTVRWPDHAVRFDAADRGTVESG